MMKSLMVTAFSILVALLPRATALSITQPWLNSTVPVPNATTSQSKFSAFEYRDLPEKRVNNLTFTGHYETQDVDEGTTEDWLDRLDNLKDDYANDAAGALVDNRGQVFTEDFLHTYLTRFQLRWTGPRFPTNAMAKRILEMVKIYIGNEARQAKGHSSFTIRVQVYGMPLLWVRKDTFPSLGFRLDGPNFRVMGNIFLGQDLPSDIANQLVQKQMDAVDRKISNEGDRPVPQGFDQIDHLGGLEMLTMGYEDGEWADFPWTLIKDVLIKLKERMAMQVAFHPCALRILYIQPQNSELIDIGTISISSERHWTSVTGSYGNGMDLLAGDVPVIGINSTRSVVTEVTRRKS